MTRMQQGTRLRRLLAMVPWLLREQHTTIDAIAARFGVPAREVVRDLSLVGMCGLPPYDPSEMLEIVVDDNGEVWAFDQGLFSRPLRLTPAEGFAVLAAGRALLAVPGADDSGPLASGLAKLEEALGAAGRLVVDLPAPAFLEEVQRAAHDQVTLEITYYSAWRDEVSNRRVDPLVVHNAEGQWYVEARDHRSGEERRFRIDRIQTLRVTGDRFESDALTPPADPRPAAEDVRLVTIVVPATARWVTELPGVESWRERRGDTVEVRIAVAGETWLELLLLRAGPGSRVTRPASLTDLGGRAAARVLGRYQATGSTNAST